MMGNCCMHSTRGTHLVRKHTLIRFAAAGSGNRTDQAAARLLKASRLAAAMSCNEETLCARLQRPLINRRRCAPL